MLEELSIRVVLRVQLNHYASFASVIEVDVNTDTIAKDELVMVGEVVERALRQPVFHRTAFFDLYQALVELDIIEVQVFLEVSHLKDPPTVAIFEQLHCYVVQDFSRLIFHVHFKSTLI